MTVLCLVTILINIRLVRGEINVNFNCRIFLIVVVFYSSREYEYILGFVYVPLFKCRESALAGVAQWIEHGTANQSVAGSIPSQGTCLGCRPGPQKGVHERQPHTAVSLPLFLPPFLSL